MKKRSTVVGCLPPSFLGRPDRTGMGASTETERQFLDSP